MQKISETNQKARRKQWLSVLLALCVFSAFSTPVAAIQNTQVDSGYLHYLAIKSDGSLWGWGNNFDGQLGNGQQGNDARKEKPIKILDNVVAVAGGSDHTMAIRSDGSLWAWGSNRFGQLGDGTNTDSLQPKMIMDGGVRSISASSSVSAAVKTDGTLWIWGTNYFGGLGSGEYSRETPKQVMEDVASVTTGGGRFFVVKKDGSLWAWGSNSHGEVGNGKAAKQFNHPDEVVTPFKLMDDVKDVAAGDFHTLVLKKDKTVWAFGYNSAGQVGDGTEKDRLKPVKVMDGVKSIAAGGYHSLAIKKDGTLWAWGSNRQSQAEGIGSNQKTPRMILSDVSSVASNGAYSLAMKQDGSLWFWRSGGVTGAGNSYDETGLPVKMW